MDFSGIRPSRVLHMGVHVTKDEPLSPVPNILTDTNGKPLFDTGYSILTAPALSSGLKVTPRTTL